jgi:hypothetical protein
MLIQNILRCSLDRNKGNVTKNPLKDIMAIKISVTAGKSLNFCNPKSYTSAVFILIF